jgi:carboxymethylenebutenolidase
MAAHDISIPYFTARPVDAQRGGSGVVLIMEGYGISPQLLRVAQRLAHIGYTVVAPDLFHRFGGSDPDAARDEGWLSKLTDDDIVEDVTAAHAVLRSLGVDRIGITGFCMGGRISYLAAVRGVDLACAAPFYGSGIGRLLGDVSCPLQFFYGGEDPWIPADEIARVEAQYPGRVTVYPTAGHGFFRDGSENYDAAAAADAWERLQAFFAEHLGAN